MRDGEWDTTARTMVPQTTAGDAWFDPDRDRRRRRGGGRAGRNPAPIDPSAAVLGVFDAAALLVLWLLRSAGPALLSVGMSYAWVVSETRFEALPAVTTPGQAFRMLLS